MSSQHAPPLKAGWNSRNYNYQFPCPYCLKQHVRTDSEDNGEDEFYLYFNCPEIGEVRITYQYADKFRRLD